MCYELLADLPFSVSEERENCKSLCAQRRRLLLVIHSRSSQLRDDKLATIRAGVKSFTSPNHSAVSVTNTYLLTVVRVKLNLGVSCSLRCCLVTQRLVKQLSRKIFRLVRINWTAPKRKVFLLRCLANR